MHLHILGICGTFMGGIAILAQELGMIVSGCDQDCYPPMAPYLRARNIHIVDTWDVQQLDDVQADLYIIGNVVSRGSPLLEAIMTRRLPYTSGPRWLWETVLSKKDVLAVAGTHGKTTTSAMLAWILSYHGLEPGFLIGGLPNNFHATARTSSSPYFVIEADEYDTAFFDKAPKFLHYRPRVLILNNLEFDHADIFHNLAEIEHHFSILLRTVPGNGALIVNQDSVALQRVLAAGCWTPIQAFGQQAPWSYRSTHSEFVVYQHHQAIGVVHWSLLGEHNKSNALAAVIAAQQVGVSVVQSCEALCHFKGVHRRLEMVAVIGGVTIYDDFAHHPTAIACTLHALVVAKRHPRIFVLLYPTSNTMTMNFWTNELQRALQEADRVFIYTPQQTQFVVKADNTVTASSLQELAVGVLATIQETDCIVVMCNRNASAIHDMLRHTLSMCR